MKKLLSLLFAFSICFCFMANASAALITKKYNTEPYTAVVNNIGGVYFYDMDTKNSVYMSYGEEVTINSEYRAVAEKTDYVKGTYKGADFEAKKSYFVKKEDFSHLTDEEISSVLANLEDETTTQAAEPDISTDSSTTEPSTTKPTTTKPTTTKPTTTKTTTTKASTTATTTATTESVTETLSEIETESTSIIATELSTVSSAETPEATSTEEVGQMKNMRNVLIIAIAVGVVVIVAVVAVTVVLKKKKEQ